MNDKNENLSALQALNGAGNFNSAAGDRKILNFSATRPSPAAQDAQSNVNTNLKFSYVAPGEQTQDSAQNKEDGVKQSPCECAVKAKFSAWFSRFCAQPHQSFFANGILLLIAYATLLCGAFAGWIDVGSPLLEYHAYVFVFVIFIQFFLGFLFVVFPKFLVQAPIAQDVYMKQFWLYFAASWGMLAAFLTDAYASAHAFMGLNFAAQILSFGLLLGIHKRSIIKDKHDTKWVLIGLFSGLAAHAAFLLAPMFSFAGGLMEVAVKAGFWLFLFVVFLSISQRMIPFFTSVKVAGYKINKSKNFMLKAYALLLLKTLAGFTAVQLVVGALLFALFAYEIRRWRLPFMRASSILWVLYLGLWWLPISFLLGTISDICALAGADFVFEETPLHAVALGYFFTILVGFGTRVTLGHSGMAIEADAFATTIFILTQAVVLVRLIAGVSLNFGLNYSLLIAVSAAVLVVALIAWGARYLPMLIKGFKP